ncbi:MAG: hypothetical protein F6K16_37170 [Symploca sp. SIO2B6]|nr:hypothetical protein [Symploca sp. SIO2B6]
MPVFPIAVYPLVYVVRKTKPTATPVKWEKVTRSTVDMRFLDYATYFSHPQRPWAIATSDHHHDLLMHIRNQGVALGEIATVFGAATVAEAYALKPLLCEALFWDKEETEATGTARVEEVLQKPKSKIPNPKLPLKFINSGTIDAYQVLWGQKPTRYLGDRYQAPIIPRILEDQLPPRRQRQARQPKLIIASMTLGLEGIFDATGEFLAGKSTTIIHSTYDLRYLLAILNSSLMSFYYRTEFSGNALSGGYLRVGPPQLKALHLVLGTPQQQQTIINLVDALMREHALVREQPQISSRLSVVPSGTSSSAAHLSATHLSAAYLSAAYLSEASSPLVSPSTAREQPQTPSLIQAKAIGQRRCCAIAHQLDHHVATLYGLSSTDFHENYGPKKIRSLL